MTITLYTRPACPQCNATKRKLRELGLDFEPIDTSQDEAAAQELRDEGYLQVPVVKTSDGRTWYGYRPDLIEALAAEQGGAQ